MKQRPALPIALLIACTFTAHATADAPAPAATGPTNAALASLDELMTRFVRRHEVPGAALAVAKHGRLIYARGFGYADRATREPVQPDSLFRIASVSKPITAVAVLKLVESGALDLDARVFDLLGLDREIPEDASSDLDPRWRSITVRHLLQHAGGWDRDSSFDAMFYPVQLALRMRADPPADGRTVIRAMLSFPLDFDPGTRYAYSNLGYCLLGRVIEAASGRPYEAFVRAEVLEPLGIRSMRLGRTRREHRAPGEVRYHVRGEPTEPSVFTQDIGRPVPKPYGAWHLEAMDAHGGWLASVVDLVRFGSSLDETARRRILRPESVHLLFERPKGPLGFEPDGKPRESYYAFGWWVRPADDGRLTTWHTGLLPGTSALLVRRYDGYCWAVLFNTHQGNDGAILSRLIDPLLHRAADRLPDWPDAIFREPTPPDAPDPLRDLPAFQARLLDAAFPSDPFPGRP